MAVHREGCSYGETQNREQGQLTSCFITMAAELNSCSTQKSQSKEAFRSLTTFNPSFRPLHLFVVMGFQPIEQFSFPWVQLLWGPSVWL